MNKQKSKRKKQAQQAMQAGMMDDMGGPPQSMGPRPMARSMRRDMPTAQTGGGSPMGSPRRPPPPQYPPVSTSMRDRPLYPQQSSRPDFDQPPPPPDMYSDRRPGTGRGMGMGMDDAMGGGPRRPMGGPMNGGGGGPMRGPIGPRPRRRNMSGFEEDMMGGGDPMMGEQFNPRGSVHMQPPVSVRSMHSMPMDDRRMIINDPPERVIRLRPQTQLTNLPLSQYDPYIDYFSSPFGPTPRGPPMLPPPSRNVLLPPPRLLTARPAMYSSMDLRAPPIDFYWKKMMQSRK